jgi:hypothetical protein
MHFKSNHPHLVKRGVVRSLVNGANVICQNQKDFNNEIKNIRHDLMFNEYPKEFVEPVMKPSIRNSPSSDTIYQGTVIIPMLRIFPRNSDASGTFSISEPFSRLNIHSVGN